MKHFWDWTWKKNKLKSWADELVTWRCILSTFRTLAGLFCQFFSHAVWCSFLALAFHVSFEILLECDVCLVLTYSEEIWLQWWTRANEQHPNQHVWYWLGVYAALGLFSLLTTFLGSWLVDIFVKLGLPSPINFEKDHYHDYTTENFPSVSRDPFT